MNPCAVIATPWYSGRLIERANGESAGRVSTRGEAPVGMDRELYLEDGDVTNAVTITSRDGTRCVATFAAVMHGAPVQRIGPVTCRSLRIAAR